MSSLVESRIQFIRSATLYGHTIAVKLGVGDQQNSYKAKVWLGALVGIVPVGLRPFSVAAVNTISDIVMAGVSNDRGRTHSDGHSEVEFFIRVKDVAATASPASVGSEVPQQSAYGGATPTATAPLLATSAPPAEQEPVFCALTKCHALWGLLPPRTLHLRIIGCLPEFCKRELHMQHRRPRSRST